MDICCISLNERLLSIYTCNGVWNVALHLLLVAECLEFIAKIEGMNSGKGDFTL